MCFYKALRPRVHLGRTGQYLPVPAFWVPIPVPIFVAILPPVRPPAISAAMIRVTDQDIERLIEKIRQPDTTFPLRDLEAAVVAEFDIDAELAHKIVAAWDRENTVD
jgi:hypothetical protein